jgi:hypothetical protein
MPIRPMLLQETFEMRTSDFLLPFHQKDQVHGQITLLLNSRLNTENVR